MLSTDKNLTISEALQYSPLTLAFLGDCVYEQLVRERLVLNANMPVNKLHREAVQKVCAAFQAKGADKILTILDETEVGIYKRGRNSSNHAVPKHSNPADYRKATGLECLFGFLHLTGNRERMIELFDIIWNIQD